MGPVDASQENCLELHYIYIFFFFYNKRTYHHIQITVLIASVAMYSGIHAGNSEEENKGYVAFKNEISIDQLGRNGVGVRWERNWVNI